MDKKKKVLLFSKEKYMIVDMVMFSVKSCLFCIFGRRHAVPLRCPPWKSCQDRRLCTLPFLGNKLHFFCVRIINFKRK